MNEDKLKGLLSLGEDIEYQDILIRNYSLKEILSNDFGFDKYNYLTGFFNIDKDILRDKYNVDIENKSLYQCILEVPDTIYWFLGVLNTFTYLQWTIGDWNDYVVYDENHKVCCRFHESKFDEFVKLLKKIYCINGKNIESEVDLEFDADEETKERLKRIEKFEEENKKNKTNKSNFTLIGIINGLVAKGRGYTYFNIYDLKMYQLMSLFYSIDHDENYMFVKDIKANGLWDDKKNPVDMNNIHWAVNNSPI